jgi:hypothetical protein
MLKIFIANRAEPIWVSENLLVRHSEMFCDALQDEHSFGQCDGDCVLSLPDDNHYVWKWLYSG